MLADPVREALERALREGDTGYPGRTTYAEALSSFAEDRYGWRGLDPARTALVADVMTGAMEAVKLVSQAGDAVVVNPPVYPPFFGFLEATGREILEVPLRARAAGPRRPGPDVRGPPAGRRSSCAPRTTRPAPCTRADELAAVARLAAEHHVRVVVDEIHAPLVLSGAQFTPYLSVPGTASAFSVMSASKGWNLAGLKAAVLVAGEDATDDLGRLPWVVSHGPTHLGVIAHTAALRQGRDWLDSLREGLEHNRRLLGELLSRHLPAVSFTAPQATYLSWLDCTALGLRSDPSAHFLEHARVAVNEGPTFGTGGVGHVRLNYATSQAILTEAVERMGASVTEPAGR